MATIILRRPQVSARTGLCRSSIYAKISEGKFPEPVHLGVRAVGWLEDEIEEWLTTRAEARRGPSSEKFRT